MTTITQNTIKSRRRQRVSDLRVPSVHPELRLTLALDEDGVEIFDFPRPPSSISHRDRESSDDSSSSDGHSAVSSPSTTPAASPTVPSPPNRIVRCKTIKPLTINKRALSPQTLDESAEDEDFYASYARSFVTLCAPLLPSFPRSTSPSMSIRKSPGPPPAGPLPPIPSHSRTTSSSSQHGPLPNYSRPMSAATRSTPHTPPPSIDTLLEIPSEEEALSLSPIVTTRNPDLDSDLEPLDLDSEEDSCAEKPLPLPPYTGWHPRPQVRASELRNLLRNPSPLPFTETCSTPTSSTTVTPALRSRWSASTLSSVRDLPTATTETSPFSARAFARRYFSAPRVARSPGKDDKEAKDSRTTKSKSKGKGKLTVDDVRVLLSPPVPSSQSDSGCPSSSLPRMSTDSTLFAHSEMGHSHSRASSYSTVDTDSADDDDDWLDMGTSLRRRRRKPIPAFLGMHAR
ncbi:hypothetical protein C8F01DRAFT_1268514 [Mycena amicta]|nr:hypothetical protein C8F01DRAFT_1268514 [Mycena amicta]